MIFKVPANEMEMKSVIDGRVQTENVPNVGKEQSEAKKLGRQPALGKLLGLLSLMCFICLNIMFKKSQVKPAIIMIFRGFSLFFIFTAGQLYEVKDLYTAYKSNYNLITARCIVSSLAIATGIFCAQNIPLSIYGLIFELSPVFALIMSAIILRECIPPLEVLLGAVAIFGVVLVIQPPFEFLGFAQLGSKLTTYQYWVTILAIAVPALVSTAFVLMRRMGTKSKPVPVTVTSGTAGLSLIVVGVIIHILTQGLVRVDCVDLTQIVYLLAIVVMSFFNQIFMYFANKFEKSPIITLIWTAKVPIFFIVDFVIFPSDVQSFNYLHYIGGVTVFSAILALLISNYFKIGKQLHSSCKQNMLNDNDSLS